MDNDAMGLVLWFQDGAYRRGDDDKEYFVPLTKWHVQKRHDDERRQRVAACGYKLNEERGRTDLFADVEWHDSIDDDVCKVCGHAVIKQDIADMNAESDV